MDVDGTKQLNDAKGRQVDGSQEILYHPESRDGNETLKMMKKEFEYDELFRPAMLIRHGSSPAFC